MNDLTQAALFMVEKYRGHRNFRITVPIQYGPVGAARFMSYIAYPKVNEGRNRERFEQALLSGAAREYGIQKKSVQRRNELAKLLGLRKILAWRDIDAAYSGRGNKVGGGVKRIIERFHAYHVFRVNDSAQAELLNLSFSKVLDNVSVAYESERSKMSEPDFRLRNLKRSFANSRAVLHLTGGMIAAHKAKGWCNMHGQLNIGPKTAISDWSWLLEAHEIAELELGLQLLEYESQQISGKKLRRHKFDPSEIVDLYLR